MAAKEKTSKINDVKEIVLGIVEIIRNVRTPHLQESFDSITDTTKIAKEIVEALRTPRDG